MTFIILRVIDPPFAATPAEAFPIGEPIEATANLASAVMHARLAFPNDRLRVAEVLYDVAPEQVLLASAVKAATPELTRALARWNEIAVLVTPKLATIRKSENFTSAYRRWRKRNTTRALLLEEIVAAVASAPQDWYAWLHFGWLLGQKDGTENCDKLLQAVRTGGMRARSPRVAAGDGGEFA